MNNRASGDGSDKLTAPPSSLMGQHEPSLQQTDTEFSAFYRETLRPLAGFLIHQGARPHVAAEIAQETLTAAYLKWNCIEHPKAWVHKVASRMFIREVVSVVEDLVEDVPEPTSLLPRPDAIGEWEAEHQALLLVRRLPPRQRQVMAWTLAGFTPTEIAEQLCLPAATVRTNLREARRAVATHHTAWREEQ